MPRERRAVAGMLLSFVAGGLLVGGVIYFAGLSRNAQWVVRAAGAASEHEQPTESKRWLKGTLDEKFDAVERHLRGLDVAMAEIGYRYQELLSAGKARNWQYAQYQTEKIDLTLRRAIERRPKRAKSSQPFLDQTIPAVMGAIKTQDGPALDAALYSLRNGCIQCHRAENVLYMGQLFATVRPTSTPQANATAIQKYQTLLSPDYLRTADRSQGRLVFSKHCANCHRLFGEGVDNGPDLTPLQRPNLDYLLTTIIDPNAMIGLDYQAVVVETTSGRTVTGLLKGEDEQALEIQTATETATKKVTIRKEGIEQRSNSSISFMPERILQQLADEEVRDLIGYLQGTAQVPVPEKSKVDNHADRARGTPKDAESSQAADSRHAPQGRV